MTSVLQTDSFHYVPHELVRFLPMKVIPRSTVNPSALEELRSIPGIGPSLARDLYDLGIRKVTDLRRRNPETLYQRLIDLRGAHQDRCVLYTFRCAVYFATEERHDPERLKWWNWKDPEPIKRKGGRR